MAEKDQAAPKGGPGKPGGMDVVEVEGWFFPKIFENRVPLKQHVAEVRAMGTREDDVMLLAFAKSGTHWLWEVGTMLLAGKAEYEKRTKEHVMMEVTDPKVMTTLPSPRLLNTHLPPSMLPDGVKVKGSGVKVIHVYRNPKDVLVSFYHHMKQMVEAVTLPMALEMFLSPNCPSGNYFTYLKAIDSFFTDNPSIPVFNMSFEEMKENPRQTVRRLADFLQVGASDDLCDAIADACDFSKMKVADKDKENPKDFKHGVSMYRKGQVGDWKNHLTVAQSERIDAAVEQLKDIERYKFRYTL